MGDEIILVVDDNRRIADFLVGSLLPSIGYRSLAAYNGTSALQTLRTRPISLLLLDLQLPDMNGLDLLRQLGREGLGVPAILTTAHGSEQVAVDAFRLGVHDYLIKPVEPDSLNAAITRALAESRLSRETSRLTSLLKDQVAWLTVLSKVGQSVTSSLKLDEVLRRIVEAGVHLTRAEEGFLALLDEQSGQLYLRAAKNIDEEKSRNMRLPVDDSLVGDVIRSLRPLRITQDSDIPSIKVSTGFLVHNLIHVPLLLKGQPLGVLSVYNRLNKRPFTEKDEAQLVSLADYAAVAIENANLYYKAQQEINERRRVEDALRESEERYALAMKGANDGLWDWDLKSEKVYFSPRWKSMLGFQEGEIGDSINEWFNRVHPDDIEKVKLEISTHLKGITSHFENEHRILHRDSTYRWVLSRGLAVWDPQGGATRMAGSQADITDRKNAEQKLLRDAFYDTLTSLPNRALFTDRLKHSIERAKRRKDYSYAVLFLDLDRFKDVNDSLGHMIGDQLLIAISHLLKNGLRSTDTIARFGGDEFVILMDDIQDLHSATRVCSWIQKKLTEPFSLSNHNVFITTSIGIVLGGPEYQRAEDVLRDADIAMYVAKEHGKARYEIFEPEMRDRILSRLALESDLRQALDRQELDIFYQPIVTLIDGVLCGFEALARWNHPRHGLLLPAAFIPLAEETSMIIAIDRWVLREACRQMVEWQKKYSLDSPLTISVNFSGKQFAQFDLVDQVNMVLKETGFDPHQLKLEITESVLMEHTEYSTSVFAQLQNIGVEVQVDDFGTGYSSLGYLQKFSVSALKIDRSFISQMGAKEDNPQIAQTVVTLAHDLGIKAVAEGVETSWQIDQLKVLGCDLGQGFLVGKPLNKESTGAILEKIKIGQNPFGILRIAQK